MQEREFNQIFSERLRYYLNKYDMTQLELSKRLGVGTTSVYNWCNGIKTPRMDKVDAMCKIFNCKRSDLTEEYVLAKSNHTGVVIPVLGRVAAGVPIEAIEEVIDTEEITEEMSKTGEFFGLIIKGDSMAPVICNGDIVIVRKQEDAESGDTVIVQVNGDEATCKRLRKYTDKIELIPNNPSYEPFEFSGAEVIEKPVKIIGKVIELRRKF